MYGPNDYIYKVFCQFNTASMTGYTFLSRDAIALQARFPVDLDALYNGTSHVALRVFESSGQQSQVRVDSLDPYASDPMNFMLNGHTGFATPVGIPELGPYLFVGVPGPPRSSYELETASGFKANGVDYSWNCFNTQHYHFVQFPNRFDSSVEPTGDEESSLSGWLSGREAVPLEDVMNSVDDYRSVVALEFGSESCGLHSVTQNWNTTSGMSIGMPFSKIVFHCLAIADTLNPAINHSNCSTLITCLFPR